METIPDITLASDCLVTRVRNWRVIENYTGSNHQYIVLDLLKEQDVVRRNLKQSPRWNCSSLDMERLTYVIDYVKNLILTKTSGVEEIIDATMRLIRRACEVSMPQKKEPKKPSVY